MKLATRKNYNPSIFFDDFFMPFNRTINTFMKTDISKRKGNYVFDIDIPGYKKEDIKVSLEDGYLNVWLEDNRDNECSEDCEIILNERFNGKYSRSFYVGYNSQTEVNATYHNGVLTIVIPEEATKQNTNTKYIEIK